VKKFKTLHDAVDDIPEGRGVYHEIIWYIERQLTLDEWIALDDAQGEAFEKVGISLDDVIGIAGPIPFSDEDAQGG
jgi:hypothetical protein